MLNKSGNPRSLGYVESAHYVLSSYAKILRNVVVSIEFDKSFNTDSICQFLENAFNKFRALQTCIQEIDSTPYLFSNVDFVSIPITVSNNNSYDDQLVNVEIEKAINQKINTNLHMWQAKIIPTNDKNLLVLTFHHSIFDGKSIIKLLNTLETNENIKRNESEIYNPIENDIHQYSTNKPLLNEIDKNNVLKLIKPSFVCNIQNQVSKCRMLNIDFINVNKIKKLCSNHNITVNDLLNALVIKSISNISNQLEKLLIHTPIDLSLHSNNPKHLNEVGCFITIIQSIINEFKNKSLLEIANLYKSEIKKSPISINTNFSYSYLKDNLIEKFDKDTAEFSGGIAISNIGAIKSSNYIESIIRNVYFATSILGGLGIFVISILTFKNSFKATISYTKPLVDEQFISEFCTNLLNEFYKMDNEISSVGDKYEE